MPDLSELERRITATKAALDGARAGYLHCPSAENQSTVEGVQRTLDSWLDLWSHRRRSEQVSA